MKVISVRDMLLCEELSHIKNEIELIHPNNLELLKSLLVQIGFDIKRELLFEPSKHRDLQGNVKIGFQICGEYSTDPKYKKFLDTTERIVVAGMVDASLGREMAGMMGKKNTYRNTDDKWEDGSRAKADDVRYYSEAQLLELGFTTGEEESDPFENEYIERTWEEDLRAIKQLEEIRDMILGVK